MGNYKKGGAIERANKRQEAMSKKQKCRICGCTEDDCSQCIRITGQPCHWVEEDLCSACQDAIKNKSQLNNTDMNFFEQLAAMGGVDMTLRIMQKNDKLTINIMPGSKVSKMQPIIITGTPAELDEEFFKTIAPEVKEIAGIVSNIEAVKKEATEKKAKKETASAEKKTDKPAAKKSATKKVVEKKAGKKKTDKPASVEASMFDNAEEPVKEKEVVEEEA